MLPVLKRDFGEYERGKVKCYFKHKKSDHKGRSLLTLTH